MATVTEEGITPTTLPGFVDLLGAAFRTALGADLDLAAESPQGQLIGRIALLLTQQDEALISVSNALSISRALGLQLDNLAALLGVTRLAATHSKVAVALTGTPSAVVPMGARAQTAAGDHFALDAAVTIGAGGSAAGNMTAVEAGPVEAAAGALTQIVDVIVGWTAVTNPAAASLGRLVETDQAYRRRYVRTLAQNARGSVEAILAAILATDGVTDAVVIDNPTSAAVTVQTRSIGAYSIIAIVEGGTDADVAAAIARSKPVGAGTTGDVSVAVPHESGQHSTTIRFRRVIPVPIAVTIDTTFGAAFPSDGVTLIKTRVADWVAGRWTSGAGDFDTTGLDIGESLDTNRLLSPALSVPGHTVATVTATRKSGNAAIAPVLLDERLTLAAADVTVS